MNSSTLPANRKIFNKVVNINAGRAQVWQQLSTPELMKKWMMPDLEIDIITDWKVGNPMMIRGKMNGRNFENQGTVLKFEPEVVLQYTHLSSLSKLPDRPESYSIVEFNLQPSVNSTVLSLTLSNFPTESIYKHLTFYWNVTLEILKKIIEEQG